MPANYVLKTITSGNSTTASAGKTGSTKLTAAQSGLPQHSHIWSQGYAVSVNGTNVTVALLSGSKSGTNNQYTKGDTGKDATSAHDHDAGMPANIGVYCWKRTA